MDLTDPCSRTGQYEAVINRSHPALLVKLAGEICFPTGPLSFATAR